MTAWRDFSVEEKKNIMESKLKKVLLSSGEECFLVLKSFLFAISTQNSLEKILEDGKILYETKCLSTLIDTFVFSCE